MFPRSYWEYLSISRQHVYDDLYNSAPSQMSIPFPLIVNPGGGTGAQFESIQSHAHNYDWAHAQYMGAGVGMAYVGHRVYTSTATRAIVYNWVRFYKDYRAIITSPIMHVRRPDMQGLDAFMHINPHLTHKGLVMVFNPMNHHINQSLPLPLYYTGLTDYATITELGHKGQKVTLDRDYTVEVIVSLAPLNYTCFIIQ